MVDWDRVSELRANGVDWDEIARDEKVGYRPDASVSNPGRALRALYHRERARQARQGPAPVAKKRPTTARDAKWTLVRSGYLLVPAIAIWFALAFVAPSPIGLLVPAIPYLALALAVVAALLVYSLWRTRTRRWTSLFRNTVIAGVIVGLVFAGLVGIVGSLVYGCPYLPPASGVGPVSSSGWHGGGNLPKWESNGKPVFYYYGATWCPYCSASSWAIWKAMVEVGSVSGADFTQYASPSEGTIASIPEVNLANAQLSNSPIDFQVSEYAGAVDGQAPTTSSCYQLAYVTAYSGGTIPFIVIGGQYVHGGSTLVDPLLLKNWSAGANGGDLTVKGQVANESGPAWNAVKNQSWWMMAMLAKSSGETPDQLATGHSWSSSTLSQVKTDYSGL
jgi:thiol-disulfide isomerase/thioredoxin